MIRYLTAGESHGPSLTVIMEGVPAGVKLEEKLLQQEMARRQQGVGRGGSCGRREATGDALLHGGLRGAGPEPQLPDRGTAPGAQPLAVVGAREVRGRTARR